MGVHNPHPVPRIGIRGAVAPHRSTLQQVAENPSVSPDGEPAPFRKGASVGGHAAQPHPVPRIGIRGAAHPTTAAHCSKLLRIPQSASLTASGPVVQSSQQALPCPLLVSLPDCGSLMPSALCPLGTRFPPSPFRKGASVGGHTPKNTRKEAVAKQQPLFPYAYP